MTFTRLHITVFLALATAVWFAVLLIQGTTVTKETFAPFSTVVAVLVGVSLLFEYVLWRIPILHGWFVARPDLRGTWVVELRSSWVNPQTGLTIGPIQGFMAVTQTLSKLQMHLMTGESQSWIVAEKITPSPKNTGYRLNVVYTNEPGTHLRGVRSEIHYGAFVLDTHGDPAKPESLSGEYWTGRGTKGTMVLSRRIDAVHSRFEDAAGAFGGNEIAGRRAGS